MHAPPTLPPLAAFAHELRTPLAGMQALVGLLRGTRLDAEQQGHVDALAEAAAQLQRFADDALDLARLPDRPPAPAPCDPRVVVEGVARTLAPLAAARGLALIVEVLPDVPARAVLDAGSVAQVLRNLAANAVRATARGAVTLRLRHDAAVGALVWEVADTGPGMTAARQARLFAPWAPGDGGGAGIGLVLARTLAGAMGGTIAVASAPGAGSTFTLRVPDGRPPRPASFNPDPAGADTRQEAPPADAGTRALPQAVP